MRVRVLVRVRVRVRVRACVHACGRARRACARARQITKRTKANCVTATGGWAGASQSDCSPASLYLRSVWRESPSPPESLVDLLRVRLCGIWHP